MNIFSGQFVFGLLLTAAPILISLAIHEFAHARVALALGDPTAKNMGRCSLNPLVHLNLVGTIMLFMVGFGWANPVPVNYSRLKKGSVGRFAVAAAGPASNLLIASICAIILRIMAASGIKIDPNSGVTVISLLVFILSFAVLINLTLCFFNLIPLFPLDGHHMLREMLSGEKKKYDFMQFQMKYGHWTLLGILFLPRLLNLPFNPMFWWYENTLFPALGFLLGGNASQLVVSALSYFSDFTPF